MPSGASTPSLTDRRRLALYRPRQAAAERLHRELQRPAARRVVERDAVPLAAARPRRARGLAARLQRRTAAFETRLDAASGLRQRPQRRDRPGRCASLGLRAPASCHPQHRRLKSIPDSRSDWMKNGRHVIAAGAPLNILASNAEAHRGMPAITDLNFLPDMGRMTGRLP